MALPNTKVEIAFNAGYTTPAASRTWTDVSAYVEAESSINITRGRQDEISQVQPSTCTVTFDNRDGRFTPEKTSGAYYPNVKKGRPIRVTSTYNAVQYVRFVGYINEWPVEWPDSTDSACEVTITASSRMARLGVSATLNSVMDEEALADAPSFKYDLDEESGATFAADSSGNQAPNLVASSGTFVFGDELEFSPNSIPAMLAPGVGIGYAMRSSGVLQDPAWIGAAFSFTGPTAFANASIVNFSGDSTGAGALLIYIDSAGQIGAGINGVGGITPTGPDVRDGLPHHVIVTAPAGGSSQVSVYLDGVLLATSASFAITRTVPSSFGVAGNLDPTAAMKVARVIGGTGTLTGSRAIAQATAILDGFAGDLSGARIARYAGYAQVPVGEQAFDTGLAPVAAIEAAGETPVNLMQKVADTENGILYDAKDSVGSLVFKDRDHRYNVASAFTLNALTQEVQGDLLPRLDDQFLVNEATATSGELSARVVDTDSTDDYGFYRQSLDVATATLDDTRALAEWRVGLNAEPTTRYPTVSVDIVNLSTSQAALVLAADISTRFGLSNLPNQAPSSTADFFIEGYSEVITESKHRITFNTSPTTGYAGTNGVWQLDVNNIDGPYILAY